MKKLILLSLTLLMATLAVAQTQRGFVKTKGRMVNGLLVPGQGLPGAVITIQGSNSRIVSNVDGSFSFEVPGGTFMVESVQKKGYELVNPEVTTRTYQQSENALYLVMETTKHLLEDQLEAEEKISRTLRKQEARARREISHLMDGNNITEEEYRQRIAKLKEEQQTNRDLIEAMAMQYAQMDYDQMDSLNQRISDAILNGRLMEADSLLRSKGDISSRLAEILRVQQAKAQEETELTQHLQELEASRAGTQKKVEDAAADCYSLFEHFKQTNQYDSAGYYIELRADLDTTNSEWLFDAAYYFHGQRQFEKARSYYEKTLEILKANYATDPERYRTNYAITLGNLSFNSIFLKQFAQAEQYAREGLQVDSTKHFIYANLAASLLFQGKYEEAEPIYRQYKEELKDSFLDDFTQYVEEGVIPKKHKKKVERIKQMLEE